MFITFTSHPPAHIKEIDTLFYYDYPSLFSVARATTPRLVEIHSAILNAGYRVSSTHCRDRGFKTDAPAAFLWDMVRAWVKRTEEETGIKKKDLPVGAPGFKILAAESTHEISFEQHADSNPGSRKDGLVRFADHKGMNWGPKTRAKMPYVEEASMTHCNHFTFDIFPRLQQETPQGQWSGLGRRAGREVVSAHSR